MAIEHFDVLIVGAGLSGIGAAHHLQTNCPGKSYAILEGRDRMGGTWDLFRYPGVRSDSDMFTLGYVFRPWVQAKAIADGPSILKYVQDTASEGAITQHIRYGHNVKAASWSTPAACWTLDIAVGGGGEVGSTSRAEPQIQQISCNFLFMCAGYYSYAGGYTPDFAGLEKFKGRVVHPQSWTPDVTHAGLRVVGIGSGATAVTLVPELAKTAAHVTMLQRSPTYMIARPAVDRVANFLRATLPAQLAYSLSRWKQVILSSMVFSWCRRSPEGAKNLLLKGVRRALGPNYDIAKHFTPRYNPWDQRLCLVPDGDFFKAIKSGRASVVTDEIECFNEQGIVLKSGQTLQADLVVTATGLCLQLLGGLALKVDGQSIDMAKTLNYKGVMYSDLPNLAASFGYTNASWTLKCDLTCQYVCRLLNHMQANGYTTCIPRNTDRSMSTIPWVDFSSGYFQRGQHLFPKQGDRAPWKLYQNYRKDIMLLRFGKLNDGVLAFEGPQKTV